MTRSASMNMSKSTIVEIYKVYMTIKSTTQNINLQ